MQENGTYAAGGEAVEGLSRDAHGEDTNEGEDHVEDGAHRD